MTRRPAPSVLVVGGGFAGVGCAKELAKHDMPVTLLDRNNYHQFQPLLYQVATAELAMIDIARPLRGIFHKRPDRRREAGRGHGGRPVDADGHDRRRRDVRRRLPGARGRIPAELLPHPRRRASTRSRSTRSIDAKRLRTRLFEVFEDADDDPALIDQGALNIVIVGAGPTGVETAGALADLVNEVDAEALPRPRHQPHPHLPRRPRPGRARRLLRQGPRLRRRQARAQRREAAARDRRHRDRARPGDAERRHRDPHPHRGLGRRHPAARRSPAESGCRRAGGTAHGRARPDRRGLSRTSTPSATWPT